MLPWEICQNVVGCHYPTFEVNWTVGILFGAILYGALLTLGFNCICLLAPQSGRNLLQLRLLRGYVFALLLVNTIFGVADFLWAYCFIIFGGSTPDLPRLTEVFSSIQLFCTLTMILIGVFTDGLLVWRCYMVQKFLVITSSKYVGTFFWLLPACLWMTMIVFGTTGAVLTNQVTTPGRLAHLATAALTTALGANIALNLFTTIFIIVRLTLYRRMIKNSFGTPTQTHHTRVVGMLLESAAINVPITIIAVVGIATGNSYGDFMMSVVTPGQSFASILVMYQVALGKAVGGRPDGIGAEVDAV